MARITTIMYDSDFPGGGRFNPDCRRVTIQEYLTLVPGNGQRNQKKRPPLIQ